MLSTSFVIPATELPLLEKSLVRCPSIRLVGVNHFGLAGQQHCDVYLDCRDTGDIYQLGAFVGQEMELLNP